MQSALINARVIKEYSDKEVSLEQIISPVLAGVLPVETQLSPLGTIPKSEQPGKWRLIKDLSSPEGASVNASFEPELCFLRY